MCLKMTREHTPRQTRRNKGGSYRLISGIATALEEFNEPKTAFTRYQAQYLVFLGVSVLIYARGR